MIAIWVFGTLACTHCDAETPGPKPAEGATVSSNADVVTTKYRYTGKMLLLSDALRKRGIKTSPEMESHIVLESDGGQLLPVLPDWRGRAFCQDERLRNRKVTLVANRRSDIGYLQPLMVFTYDEKGEPQFTDYWCDICSIPMYEIQPCECCQGDIRLRYTLQTLPDDVDDWTPTVNASEFSR